jgi:hypothetical protein
VVGIEFIFLTTNVLMNQKQRQDFRPEVFAHTGHNFLRGENAIRLQDRTLDPPPSRLDLYFARGELTQA